MKLLFFLTWFIIWLNALHFISHFHLYLFSFRGLNLHNRLLTEGLKKEKSFTGKMVSDVGKTKGNKKPQEEHGRQETRKMSEGIKKSHIN